MYIIAVPDGRGLRMTMNKKTRVSSERLNLANKTDVRTGISSQLQQSNSEKQSKERTSEQVWSSWRGICQVNI